jgi:L-ascorbate metabolism protein UlaG (beta-lactamase superfamily)
MRGVLVLTLVSTLALVSGCRAFKVISGPFVYTAPVPNKIQRPVRADARLAALWVGHATVLLQIDDRIVLTDPVFSATVGQMSRRVVEAGLDVDAVPLLDAVVISHLHFDHLSLESLDMLEPRIKRMFMPPTGLTYVPDYRFPIHELPWGKRWTDGELTITAVPVQHNGWRFVLDSGWMKKGYTGYLLERGGLRVYFGGDTGYGPHFKRTREKFGPIDLAILPIGPLEPRALMAPSHIDPNEALDAFRDLDARYMLAVHFDTFPNSLDAPGAAPRALRAAAKARGVGEDRIVILAPGEQRVFVPR